MDEQRLLRAFARAGEELRKGASSEKGGVAAEAKYAQTYQALVRAGLAPQIRRKYRIGGLA